MVSYDLYKFVHLVGIIVVLVALGAMSSRGLSGASPDGGEGGASYRRLTAILHGVGLLIVLVGGFGLLARLGFDHGEIFPGWVIAKLVIWFTLGAAIVAVPKQPKLARLLLVVVPLLAAAAVFFALYKPF